MRGASGNLPRIWLTPDGVYERLRSLSSSRLPGSGGTSMSGGGGWGCRCVFTPTRTRPDWQALTRLPAAPSMCPGSVSAGVPAPEQPGFWIRDIVQGLPCPSPFLALACLFQGFTCPISRALFFPWLPPGQARIGSDLCSGRMTKSLGGCLRVRLNPRSLTGFQK